MIAVHSKRHQGIAIRTGYRNLLSIHIVASAIAASAIVASTIVASAIVASAGEQAIATRLI